LDIFTSVKSYDLNNKQLLPAGEYYLFIACWRGKYENLFTQEYHFLWGQRSREIWYSGVNKLSYFLNLHAINVLLYRMKPRKHIHVTYCWQTYFKPHPQHCNGRLQKVMCSVCLGRFPVKERKLWRENLQGFRGGGIWFLSCVITCSDFYPLSNQINIFTVINMRGIIFLNSVFVKNRPPAKLTFSIQFLVGSTGS
jgi:hypothetical protein